MKDTKNIRDIIVDALNKKLGERQLACPVCGAKDDNTWDVQAETTTLLAHEDPSEPTHTAKAAYPMAVLICRGCGYTALMNLIVLGVAEQLGISVRYNEQ